MLLLFTIRNGIATEGRNLLLAGAIRYLAFAPGKEDEQIPPLGRNAKVGLWSVGPSKSFSEALRAVLNPKPKLS